MHIALVLAPSIEPRGHIGQIGSTLGKSATFAGNNLILNFFKDVSVLVGALRVNSADYTDYTDVFETGPHLSN